MNSRRRSYTEAWRVQTPYYERRLVVLVDGGGAKSVDMGGAIGDKLLELLGSEGAGRLNRQADLHEGEGHIGEGEAGEGVEDGAARIEAIGRMGVLGNGLQVAALVTSGWCASVVSDAGKSGYWRP